MRWKAIVVACCYTTVGGSGVSNGDEGCLCGCVRVDQGPGFGTRGSEHRSLSRPSGDSVRQGEGVTIGRLESRVQVGTIDEQPTEQCERPLQTCVESFRRFQRATCILRKLRRHPTRQVRGARSGLFQAPRTCGILPCRHAIGCRTACPVLSATLFGLDSTVLTACAGLAGISRAGMQARTTLIHAPSNGAWRVTSKSYRRL